MLRVLETIASPGSRVEGQKDKRGKTPDPFTAVNSDGERVGGVLVKEQSRGGDHVSGVTALVSEAPGPVGQSGP